MSETFTSKLGNTSKAGERTRIWLEGTRLTAHGFTVGTLYRRAWNDNDGVLTLTVIDRARFDELARAEKGTVSGKGNKPIIDIVGAQVRNVFGEKANAVYVAFSKGRIVITRI